MEAAVVCADRDVNTIFHMLRDNSPTDPGACPAPRPPPRPPAWFAAGNDSVVFTPRTHAWLRPSRHRLLPSSIQSRGILRALSLYFSKKRESLPSELEMAGRAWCRFDDGTLSSAVRDPLPAPRRPPRRRPPRCPSQRRCRYKVGVLAYSGQRLVAARTSKWATGVT